LLQIDDVDAVALGEDVALHLRVPAPGLVTEVDAALQELLHADDRSHDGTVLSFVRRASSRRDAARLVPGARDMTRLRPAWRPATERRGPAGGFVCSTPEGSRHAS